MSILILDDDQAIRETMKIILEAEGYEVHTAANGLEGIADLCRHSELPALILLDFSMPKMNGRDFLRELKLKKEWSHIPTVLLTAAGSEKTQSLETDDVVPKPLHLQELIDVVKRFAALDSPPPLPELKTA